MNFLQSTWSGVTFFQLFGGWILAGVLALLSIFLFVAWVGKRDEVELWEVIDGRNRAHLTDRIEKLAERIKTLVDNKLSLEARLNKAISRPRGKDGRFKAGGK